ncbi:hypothetical protein TNCV_1985601 [Trichonephila clavipes]|nr:hypothetical protein TNCV_1985601 [Trichonephila clavipes]
MLINSLREDTEYLLDLGLNGRGQSNRTLPVVWLGRVNRYPYPRIKCMKYRNLNQVTRAEIYLLLKRERLVGKINVATCVTVLDLWKWYFRRSLLMNYPKHTTCVMTVGMYIIKKSRFKLFCAYDGCNLTTLILRLLEQIDVSRMVDTDILIQIWKNRVKKIDFVLKWLSRVGSDRPKGEKGESGRENGRKEKEGRRKRREREREGEREKRREEKTGETEKEKGRVRNWSEKDDERRWR